MGSGPTSGGRQKQAKLCPYCDTPNEPTAQFCINDGEPLSHVGVIGVKVDTLLGVEAIVRPQSGRPPGEDTTLEETCFHCQKVLAEGGVFCLYCGGALRRASGRRRPKGHVMFDEAPVRPHAPASAKAQAAGPWACPDCEHENAVTSSACERCGVEPRLPRKLGQKRPTKGLHQERPAAPGAGRDRGEGTLADERPVQPVNFLSGPGEEGKGRARSGETVLDEGLQIVGWLVSFDGRRSGHGHELYNGKCVIGSSAQARVRIASDPSVRGEHAQIQTRGDQCRISALGRDTPVWVNGEHLGSRGGLNLVSGDVVQVGDTRLLLHLLDREVLENIWGGDP